MVSQARLKHTVLGGEREADEIMKDLSRNPKLPPRGETTEEYYEEEEKEKIQTEPASAAKTYFGEPIPQTASPLARLDTGIHKIGQ